MANDQPNGFDLLKNGNNLNKTQTKKVDRFDEYRQLKGDSDDESDINKVKEKNRDLKFMVGRLQKQLNDLIDQVKQLNDIILKEKSEKDKLFDLLQRKSETKSPSKPSKKRKKIIVKNKQKTTQNMTPTKANVSYALNVKEDTNATEKDSNGTQTTNAQVQDPHSAANSNAKHVQQQNNDIEMSGSGVSSNDGKRLRDSESSDGDSTSSEIDSDVDGDDEDSKNDKKTHSKSNNRTTTSAKRLHKIPPIDVWTDKRADIQRELQSIVPGNSCLYSRINNAKFHMFPSDAATRINVIEYLKSKKYDYNTYTPSDSKMINVLIKGLDHIESADVIKCELASKGFEPYQIKKHITGYMRKNNAKSNLWLIVLQPNTDTQELFKIKAIDHAIVKFEFLRKPKVIQCRRCQRFNHSASNCNLPYRCVKCTESHEPGKCESTTKNNKFKPKCVNCLGNHTANDAANCEVFKKVIASKENKQKSQSDNNKSSKTANNESSMRSTQTYAEKVKVSINKKPVSKNQNTNFDKFINNQNKMMSDFMATIKKMQQQFISSFTNKNG